MHFSLNQLAKRLEFYARRSEQGKTNFPFSGNYHKWFQSLREDDPPEVQEEYDSSDAEDSDPDCYGDEENKKQMPSWEATWDAIEEQLLQSKFTTEFMMAVFLRCQTELCYHTPEERLSQCLVNHDNPDKFFFLMKNYPPSHGETWDLKPERFDRLVAMGMNDEQLLWLAEVVDTPYEDATSYGPDLLSMAIPRAEFSDVTIAELFKMKKFAHNFTEYPSYGLSDSPVAFDHPTLTNAFGTPYRSKVSLLLRHRPNLIDHPEASQLYATSSMFQYLEFPVDEVEKQLHDDLEMLGDDMFEDLQKDEQKLYSTLKPLKMSREMFGTPDPEKPLLYYHLSVYDLIHWWWFRSYRRVQEYQNPLCPQVMYQVTCFSEHNRYSEARLNWATAMVRDPIIYHTITDAELVDLLKPDFCEIKDSDSHWSYEEHEEIGKTLALPWQADRGGETDVNIIHYLLSHRLKTQTVRQMKKKYFPWIYRLANLLEMTQHYAYRELNQKATNYDTASKSHHVNESIPWTSQLLLKGYAEARAYYYRRSHPIEQLRTMDLPEWKERAPEDQEKMTLPAMEWLVERHYPVPGHWFSRLEPEPPLLEDYRRAMRALIRSHSHIYPDEIPAIERMLGQTVFDVYFHEDWLEDPNVSPQRYFNGDSLYYHLWHYAPSSHWCRKLMTHPDFRPAELDCNPMHLILNKLKETRWAKDLADGPLEELRKELLTDLLQTTVVCNAEQVKTLTAKGIDVFSIVQSNVARHEAENVTLKKNLKAMHQRIEHEDQRYQQLMDRCTRSEEREMKLLGFQQQMFAFQRQMAEQQRLMNQGWNQIRGVLAQEGEENPVLVLPEMPALPQLTLEGFSEEAPLMEPPPMDEIPVEEEEF